MPLSRARRAHDARRGEICAGEEWILDHAYGKWREIPLARAELIVALDYPRWLSLSRLIGRTLYLVAGPADGPATLWKTDLS